MKNNKIYITDAYKVKHDTLAYKQPIVESESPKVIVIGDSKGGCVEALRNTMEHGIFLFQDKEITSEITITGKIILREMIKKCDLIIKKNTDGL